MQRFIEKVVVVSGGGSGIGAATARAFAREGANVVVADVNADAGRSCVSKIEWDGGKANFDALTQGFVKAVTPLGLWGELEEVAEAILFLASGAASFVTGTLLRIDGGWRSK